MNDRKLIITIDNNGGVSFDNSDKISGLELIGLAELLKENSKSDYILRDEVMHSGPPLDKEMD